MSTLRKATTPREWAAHVYRVQNGLNGPNWVIYRVEHGLFGADLLVNRLTRWRYLFDGSCMRAVDNAPPGDPTHGFKVVS